MAYTTVTGTEDNLDEEVASFESGVTSIDAIHGIASHGHGQVVALVEYTP